MLILALGKFIILQTLFYGNKAVPFPYKQYFNWSRPDINRYLCTASGPVSEKHCSCPMYGYSETRCVDWLWTKQYADLTKDEYLEVVEAETKITDHNIKPCHNIIYPLDESHKSESMKLRDQYWKDGLQDCARQKEDKQKILAPVLFDDSSVYVNGKCLENDGISKYQSLRVLAKCRSAYHIKDKFFTIDLQKRNMRKCYFKADESQLSAYVKMNDRCQGETRLCDRKNKHYHLCHAYFAPTHGYWNEHCYKCSKSGATQFPLDTPEKVEAETGMGGMSQGLPHGVQGFPQMGDFGMFGMPFVKPGPNPNPASNQDPTDKPNELQDEIDYPATFTLIANNEGEYMVKKIRHVFPMEKFFGVELTENNYTVLKDSMTCGGKDKKGLCCDCSSLCVKFGTCCLDKFWDEEDPISINAYKNLIIDKQRLYKSPGCRKLIPFLPKNMTKAYYMVSTCSYGMFGMYGTKEDISKCSEANHTTADTFVPVIGSDEYLYRNLYCARCNNIYDYQFVNVTIKRDEVYNQTNFMYALSDLPENVTKRCDSAIAGLEKCLTYNKDSKLCHSYKAPIEGFVNFHCKKCSTYEALETFDVTGCSLGNSSSMNETKRMKSTTINIDSIIDASICHEIGVLKNFFSLCNEKKPVIDEMKEEELVEKNDNKVYLCSNNGDNYDCEIDFYCTKIGTGSFANSSINNQHKISLQQAPCTNRSHTNTSQESICLAPEETLNNNETQASFFDVFHNRPFLCRDLSVLEVNSILVRFASECKPGVTNQMKDLSGKMKPLYMVACREHKFLLPKDELFFLLGNNLTINSKTDLLINSEGEMDFLDLSSLVLPDQGSDVYSVNHETTTNKSKIVSPVFPVFPVFPGKGNENEPLDPDNKNISTTPIPSHLNKTDLKSTTAIPGVKNSNKTIYITGITLPGSTKTLQNGTQVLRTNATLNTTYKPVSTNTTSSTTLQPVIPTKRTEGTFQPPTEFTEMTGQIPTTSTESPFITMPEYSWLKSGRKIDIFVSHLSNTISIVGYIISIFIYHSLKNMKKMFGISPLILVVTLLLTDALYLFSGILQETGFNEMCLLCGTIAFIIHGSLLSAHVCNIYMVRDVVFRFTKSNASKKCEELSILVSCFSVLIILTIASVLDHYDIIQMGYGDGGICKAHDFNGRLIFEMLPVIITFLLSIGYTANILHTSMRQKNNERNSLLTNALLFVFKITLVIGITEGIGFIQAKTTVPPEEREMLNLISDIIYSLARCLRSVALLFLFMCEKTTVPSIQSNDSSTLDMAMIEADPKSVFDPQEESDMHFNKEYDCDPAYEKKVKVEHGAMKEDEEHYVKSTATDDKEGHKHHSHVSKEFTEATCSSDNYEMLLEVI